VRSAALDAVEAAPDHTEKRASTFTVEVFVVVVAKQLGVQALQQSTRRALNRTKRKWRNTNPCVRAVRALEVTGRMWCLLFQTLRQRNDVHSGAFACLRHEESAFFTDWYASAPEM
jgi:hypothetical protein